MEDADVIVVGAGPAGLSATINLQAAGLQVRLLEQDDVVGGRVRTDEVDGFLLDRGFQVLLPAYPELGRLFDLDRLDLRAFASGVLVDGQDRRWDLGLPGRRTGTWGSLIRFGAERPLDAVSVAAFSLRDTLTPGPRLRRSRTGGIERELQRRRISERTIDEVFRPFLAGVFLDPGLDTNARMFHLVWRCFLRGGAAVPANGMRQLPLSLAELVKDDALRLSTPVEAVEHGAVRTAAGRLEARAVVVACDGAAAARLLPQVQEPSWRSTTTWYFAAPEPPSDRPVLMLDGASGSLLNTVVMSAVAPSYAPAGRALVSASVPDCEHTADEIRGRLAHLYGTSTQRWELIAEYRLPRALPRMSSDHVFTSPAKVAPGTYVCGDHRDTSSIQGALVSGRRVAAAVARDLAGR